MPWSFALQALQQELGFDPEDPEFDLGGEGDSWQQAGAERAPPGAAATPPLSVRHMHAMEQALQRQLNVETDEGRAEGRAAGRARHVANGSSAGRLDDDLNDKMS